MPITPRGYLPIADAVNLIGQKTVDHWDGTETSDSIQMINHPTGGLKEREKECKKLEIEYLNSTYNSILKNLSKKDIYYIIDKIKVINIMKPEFLIGDNSDIPKFDGNPIELPMQIIDDIRAFVDIKIDWNRRQASRARSMKAIRWLREVSSSELVQAIYYNDTGRHVIPATYWMNDLSDSALQSGGYYIHNVTPTSFPIFVRANQLQNLLSCNDSSFNLNTKSYAIPDTRRQILQKSSLVDSAEIIIDYLNENNQRLGIKECAKFLRAMQKFNLTRDRSIEIMSDLISKQNWKKGRRRLDEPDVDYLKLGEYLGIPAGDIPIRQK